MLGVGSTLLGDSIGFVLDADNESLVKWGCGKWQGGWCGSSRRLAVACGRVVSEKSDGCCCVESWMARATKRAISILGNRKPPPILST